MATEGHARPYILEAVGLIVLFAVAMAAIAFPVRWMGQSDALPLQVQANKTQ